jgi:hypothetical protein
VHPLVAYLFDHRSHSLLSSVSDWLAASPRFAAFAETYKDKIRKKIRRLKGDEAALDLRAELETAYLLLAEKRFEVSFEPYAVEKGRGPDFAVTWRTTLTFNVEVTRLRSTSGDLEGKLLDVVCEKFGQMLPGMINVLVVEGSGLDAALDVGSVMQRLKLSAEKRDPSLYARQGFRSPADFFKGYERLSGLLLRPGEGGASILWNNPQARHDLPAKVRSLLVVESS